VVGVAFLVVVALAALGIDLPFEIVHRDSRQYIELASNLSEHGVFGFTPEASVARRELLYPLFLAGFMKLGLVTPYDFEPTNFWPVLLAQAGLYLLALRLLADRATQYFEAPVATVTIYLGGAYFIISQYAFQILSELLAMVLVVCLFWLLDRRTDRAERRHLSLAALALGLLGILKSVAIPTAPLIAGFLVLTRRLTLRLAALFVVIALAFPAAWTTRNYVRFDRWILSTTDGASTLYRGNMGLGFQPAGWSDPRIPEEVREERKRLGLAADAYLKRLTRERFFSHPGECALQVLFKLMVLWVGEPGSASRTAAFLIRLTLLLLIVAGVGRAARSREPMQWLLLLLCLYLSIVYPLILTTPRYAAPAIIMLFPLAAETLLRLGKRLPSRALAGTDGA